jgi:hypothetical protein
MSNNPTPDEIPDYAAMAGLGPTDYSHQHAGEGDVVSIESTSPPGDRMARAGVDHATHIRTYHADGTWTHEQIQLTDHDFVNYTSDTRHPDGTNTVLDMNSPAGLTETHYTHREADSGYAVPYQGDHMGQRLPWSFEGDPAGGIEHDPELEGL